MEHLAQRATRLNKTMQEFERDRYRLTGEPLQIFEREGLGLYRVAFYELMKFKQGAGPGM